MAPNLTAVDFTPISALASVPTVLVINPELGLKDLPAFLAAAKQSPRKFNYGSPGIGSNFSGSSHEIMTAPGIDGRSCAWRHCS